MKKSKESGESEAKSRFTGEQYAAMGFLMALFTLNSEVADYYHGK